jgi:hypothetical protein
MQDKRKQHRLVSYLLDDLRFVDLKNYTYSVLNFKNCEHNFTKKHIQNWND